MNRLISNAVRGAAAGAAGTTALNAATYLDMAVPGGEKERAHRIAGLGPILGLAAGIGAGAVIGAARSAVPRPSLPPMAVGAAVLAMVAGNGPMAALGVVAGGPGARNLAAGLRFTPG